MLSFVAIAQASAQDCSCMIPLDETFSVVPMNSGTAPDYRNDDGYSAEVSLPFTFNLFGESHNSIFINNNGNLSFGNGYSTFSASGFPIDNFPMVSAYWADVDTRNLESGLVYYKVTDNAMIVRYNEVGYFPNAADQVNDFQIIISDGTSELIGSGHTISFCYGDMQWSTGTAATVGVNAGNGNVAMQIGRFNEASTIYDGPYSNPDDVNFLDNSNITFSTNSATENQAPVNVSNLCDTIFGNAGDTLLFFFYDAIDQDIEFDVEDSSGYFNPMDSTEAGFVVIDGFIAQNTRTNGDRENGDLSYALQIDPNTPDGTYTFVVSATDNGVPSLTSTYVYTVQIGEAILNVQEKEQIKVTAYINAGILQFKGLDGLNVEQFTLYNSNGQNILQTNRLIGGVNMEMMPNGVYLYTIRANGQLISGKIIR
jgi:hypothetical protein